MNLRFCKKQIRCSAVTLLICLCVLFACYVGVSEFNISGITRNGVSDLKHITYKWEDSDRVDSGNLKDENYLKVQEVYQSKLSIDRHRSLSSTIPVYIVEEHHEVIPYWFMAAKDGRIPTRGNIMVHIDGHPDTSIPKYPTGTKIFQHPKTADLYKHMMMRNDQFIWASVFSGFISRMIWIYPSWNKDFDKDSTSLVGFGYAFNRTYKDEYPLCFCYDQMECYHVNREHRSSKYPRILKTDCAIKQIVISEEISDARAAELSQSGDWIPSTDNVFYDIDEDYYGCQAAIQPLMDVNITEDYIDDSLLPAIMNIFCPGDAKSEQGVDKIYYNLLRRISDRSGKKLRTVQQNEIVEQTLQDVKKGGLMIELCNPLTVEDDLKGIIATLTILDKQQLKALADLGICLQSTSREYGFNRMDGMKLCDGYNRPGNRSLVFFHTPSLNEINKRTRQLEVILKPLPEPKFVSLCRSSRDGYVPGQFVSKIETDIIQTLGKVFPNIKESSLHYDDELHGGRKGWYKRHPETLW